MLEINKKKKVSNKLIKWLFIILVFIIIHCFNNKDYYK